MKFLIAAAGSAGHINPALATADALRDIMGDCGILFVGAGRAMEKKLIPAAGYELRNIEMQGLSRGFSPKKLAYNFNSAKLLLTASKRAGELINEYKPDAVIGLGGYICYPVLRAAAKAKIPTVMHESNAEPGLTMKMLSGTVTRVFTAYRNTEQLYSDPARVTAIGTPVRRGFSAYTRERARLELGIADDENVVVSFWGSLGASGMNELMRAFISRNMRETAFRHIHAVGSEKGAEALRAAVSADIPLPANVDIRPYIDDMPRVMAAADLVLCRSGGSTLAELSALGRAAVLIPSPFVANDEQANNARAVEQAGGAVVAVEADSTGESLFETVTALLKTPRIIEKMEEAQRNLGAADAANRLAAEIIGLL
ncbi:MAG: UDP-N-acetylglucosamine--N-acetylmuramyl-(pentapeptide) pyrophosphoryl-undecaprenol N-acetylglucosamine transferase [Oscillospiraceae bacterium]|jgi:UDP-N-acetylglucosamine--N-acetylmuramyl-(pentapeptide) pyrophosphoryl-undecaprenol N-acetylglucosamine transferase|nr:UDP-N-acetylglucosamine--N-acetylmuramyl-(pentapeptide) pyrophosphoryl-undecaprenol N-acetylglucosamine transferase [Oscillospiraceae bacterium]